MEAAEKLNNLLFSVKVPYLICTVVWKVHEICNFIMIFDENMFIKVCGVNYSLLWLLLHDGSLHFFLVFAKWRLFSQTFLVKFILVLVHNSNPKFHIFLVRTYSATTAMHFKVEKKKVFIKRDDDEKVRNAWGLFAQMSHTFPCSCKWRSSWINFFDSSWTSSSSNADV